MAVYPDGSKPHPEGVYTASSVAGLQDLTEEKIRAQIRSRNLSPWDRVQANFQRTVNGVVAGVVNLFGGALLGTWKQIDPDDIDLSSGQLQINGRTDLLDGVRGYCATFQSKNIDSGKQEGIFSHGLPGYRMLPFNRQLGPAKGAHPHPDGGIVFDEPGLWTVYVYAFLGDSPDILSAALRDHNYLRMTVWDRDIKSDDAQRYDGLDWVDYGQVGTFKMVSLSIPVVVPEAGYMVTVEGRGTHNRWWRGGTRYSRLAVVKHDNRVEHLPQETVPNE